MYKNPISFYSFPRRNMQHYWRWNRSITVIWRHLPNFNIFNTLLNLYYSFQVGCREFVLDDTCYLLDTSALILNYWTSHLSLFRFRLMSTFNADCVITVALLKSACVAIGYGNQRIHLWCHQTTGNFIMLFFRIGFRVKIVNRIKNAQSRNFHCRNFDIWLLPIRSSKSIRMKERV